MPRLDGHQPAEPVAEHEDRPEPQRAAGGEQNDPEPADGVAINGPKLVPVGVGREESLQQPDRSERRKDPAIASILAYAGGNLSAAPVTAKNTIASAISAGCEKKAADPAQPRMARPK